MLAISDHTVFWNGSISHHSANSFFKSSFLMLSINIFSRAMSLPMKVTLNLILFFRGLFSRQNVSSEYKPKVSNILVLVTVVAVAVNVASRTLESNNERSSNRL